MGARLAAVDSRDDESGWQEDKDRQWQIVDTVQ